MASYRQKADRIFVGKNIITVDDAYPSAEAVAVQGDIIVFVGTEEDAFSEWKDDQTVIQRLEGDETLLPGFIDPHSHLYATGIQQYLANLLYPPDGKSRTVTDLIKILREWAEENPESKSPWVFGFGWDESVLGKPENWDDDHSNEPYIGKAPTRHDLDAVSTTRPVAAAHQSFHLGVLNTAGLELLGWKQEDNSWPPNLNQAYIDKDEKGLPTGLVLEDAFTQAANLSIAKLGVSPFDIYRAGVKAVINYGFTTVQEGAASQQQLLLLKNIPPHIFTVDLVVYALAKEAVEFVKSYPAKDFIQVSQDYVSGWRYAGVKTFLDGSPQGRTAWLTEPYKIPPPGKTHPYHGISTVSDDQAIAEVSLAYKNGWQHQAHVNGDRSIDQYIKAVKTVTGGKSLGNRKFVAIHSQLSRKDQVQAFKELGIIPTFFSMHTYYWGDWYRDVVLGAPRYENISPARWALDLEIRYTSHHDAPVTSPNPFAILYGQAFRRSRSGKVIGEHQRVSVLDAIKAITINAAHQYSEDDKKGSITVGKLADLVILNKNPLKISDPQPLFAELKVLETIKNGKTILSTKVSK